MQVQSCRIHLQLTLNCEMFRHGKNTEDGNIQLLSPCGTIAILHHIELAGKENYSCSKGVSTMGSNSKGVRVCRQSISRQLLPWCYYVCRFISITS